MFPKRNYEYNKKGLQEKAVRMLSFQGGLLSQYSWLEYSISQDKKFCFPCRVDGTSQRDLPYVEGTSPWNNPRRKVHYHNGSHHHKQCVLIL
jgi:hypothetical protein